VSRADCVHRMGEGVAKGVILSEPTGEQRSACQKRNGGAGGGEGSHKSKAAGGGDEEGHTRAGTTGNTQPGQKKTLKQKAWILEKGGKRGSGLRRWTRGPTGEEI